MEQKATCPDCGNDLGKVKLGSEPARLICGRFGCEFDGVKAEDNRMTA